jgi:hypothetical protein
MSMACSTHGSERRNIYRVLVRNPDGNRTLERSRYKCEDNITRSFGKN